MISPFCGSNKRGISWASVDFPAPDTERKILSERTGIADDVAEKMVRFAGEIRITYSKGEIGYVLSTRDMIMWAMMYKVYGKFMLAAEMSILNKIHADDFEAIKDVMNLHFKSADAQTVNAKGGPDEEVI